jgi:hypothetical protein
MGHHVATGRRELEGAWRIRGRVRHNGRRIDRLKPVQAAMIGFSRITASQLLRLWDDGRIVRSCKMGADDEHRIQCMAFEILRRFIAHPCDFEAIERANDPLVLGRLVLELKTLPALNRMQPFTDIQLAQAACLARLLADYARIPEGRKIRVRRLAVVAAV